MEMMRKMGFMICVVTVLLSNMMVPVLKGASAQCQGDFQGLIKECSRYVQKPGPPQNPSQQCCNVVRNVDLPCVCHHVTTQVEQIISMKKAASVSAFCGKPLPHGAQCGSYTVPRS